jgi:hypothetical protein
MINKYTEAWVGLILGILFLIGWKISKYFSITLLGLSPKMLLSIGILGILWWIIGMIVIKFCSKRK